MKANIFDVLVEPGRCSSCAVHAVIARHRMYPELRAEAGSAREALEQLLARLRVAREFAPTAWHREDIEAAMRDVDLVRRETPVDDRAGLEDCEKEKQRKKG